MFNPFKKQPQIKATAIIMAAGQSTRMNIGESKLFINIMDKPLIAYSLHAFEQVQYIDNIIIVTREQDIIDMWDIVSMFEITKVSSIVKGGKTRQQSVLIGLNEANDSDIVAIHDGARPCITPEQIEKTIEIAIKHGAAAIGCKVNDTIKYVEDGLITKTINRDNLWQIQTPQVFKKELIQNAHIEADKKGIIVTDDTALLEELSIPVYMVEGSSANIKVTTKTDINIAKSILGDYN